jgi:hypothetical protein
MNELAIVKLGKAKPCQALLSQRPLLNGMSISKGSHNDSRGKISIVLVLYRPTSTIHELPPKGGQYRSMKDRSRHDPTLQSLIQNSTNLAEQKCHGFFVKRCHILI